MAGQEIGRQLMGTSFSKCEPSEESTYTRDITGVKFVLPVQNKELWEGDKLYSLRMLNHGTAASLQPGRRIYFGSVGLLISNVMIEIEKDHRKGQGTLLVEVTIPVGDKTEIEKQLFGEGWHVSDHLQM